jgi:hypothetical protein
MNWVTVMKKLLLILIFIFLKSSMTNAQIIITFSVDATGFPVYEGGMHIAGQFLKDGCLTIQEDWQPGTLGSKMTALNNSTYTLTVAFPDSSMGDSLQFEFVRDSLWMHLSEDVSEGNPGDPTNFLNDSCAFPDGNGLGGFNRLILIPHCDGVYDCKFNYCGFTVTSLPPPMITQNGNTLTSSQADITNGS